METTTERPQKRFLTPQKVVDLALEQGLENVSLSTVKRASYYGDKPLTRTMVGGRVYYALEDVEKWIEGCKVDPALTAAEQKRAKALREIEEADAELAM